MLKLIWFELNDVCESVQKFQRFHTQEQVDTFAASLRTTENFGWILCQTTVKKFEKADILWLLEQSDVAVGRGIVAVYKQQTDDEQASAATLKQNGRGFTGADAQFLTSLAQQIEKGRGLSSKQLTYARRKIMKYAGQLAKIANKEL